MSEIKPLFSIITSTFNAGRFLENSILSVSSQTYKNYEYIIIDGASTDDTLELIKTYNSEITYWSSEKDNGIYEAWNKGIRQAKGDWILFIGADDQLLPDALETYANFINRHISESYDYVSSKVERIRLDGTLEGIVGKSWKWNEFQHRMTTAHPGSIHSKYFFQKFGYYSTEYKIVADYELLLRARNTLMAGFIDKVTVSMYTGSRFGDYEAIAECLKMQKDSKIKNFFSYNLHFININLRYFIKELLKRI
jgi:glycosyltransferase involved in cell wall biosynthesis